MLSTTRSVVYVVSPVSSTTIDAGCSDIRLMGSTGFCGRCTLAVPPISRCLFVTVVLGPRGRWVGRESNRCAPRVSRIAIDGPVSNVESSRRWAGSMTTVDPCAGTATRSLFANTEPWSAGAAGLQPRPGALPASPSATPARRSCGETRPASVRAATAGDVLTSSPGTV